MISMTKPNTFIEDLVDNDTIVDDDDKPNQNSDFLAFSDFLE